MKQCHIYEVRFHDKEAENSWIKQYFQYEGRVKGKAINVLKQHTMSEYALGNESILET